MVRRTKAEAEQTRQQILDAARCVFHACGVGRSSLEQIAHAAGVTRGAVYWHFQNKRDLFFAMREQATLPLIDEADAMIADPEQADPLDAIQRAIEHFMHRLREDHSARQVFEIMRFRCEYVDEFASVQETLLESQNNFRGLLEEAYRQAHAKGLLRPGLDPVLLARDTQIFACGLMERYLVDPQCETASAVSELIGAHLAMRRA